MVKKLKINYNIYIYIYKCFMQFYYENDENYVNLSVSTILGAAIEQE